MELNFVIVVLLISCVTGSPVELSRITRHQPGRTQADSLTLLAAALDEDYHGSGMESSETKAVMDRITSHQPEENVHHTSSLAEEEQGSGMGTSETKEVFSRITRHQPDVHHHVNLHLLDDQESGVESSEETKKAHSRITRHQPGEHVQLHALDEDDQGSGMESSGTTNVLSGITDSDLMCIMQVLLCWLEIREQEWRALEQSRLSPALAGTNKVYVECIVKNPLCELGALLQNKHFSSKLDSFVRARPSSVPAA